MLRKNLSPVIILLLSLIGVLFFTVNCSEEIIYSESGGGDQVITTTTNTYVSTTTTTSVAGTSTTTSAYVSTTTTNEDASTTLGTGDTSTTTAIVEETTTTTTDTYVSTSTSTSTLLSTSTTTTTNGSPTTTTTIDTIAPTATVAYSTTAVTNGNVTATITPSEAVAITNNSGLTTYTFSANGSFIFNFTDSAGNTGSATATVGNIDKTAPTATVAYSTTAPTNGSVTATITPSETVTITNNDGLNSYTFSTNGSFTFNFTDSAGNTGSVTATVGNIDKTPPVDPSISINPTTPTSGDVTVTITFSGDSTVKQYKIGTGSYQSYTAPFTVSEDTIIYAKAQDAVGNWSGEVNYSITNIDKEAPVISTFTRTSDASSDSSIITFNLSGTDNVGITGWFISKSSATPLINDAGWLADKPLNFDIGSGSTAGIYTVYIWAKDAAGNISGVKSISFEFYIVSLAGYVKDSANNAIYGALIRLYNNNYSFLTSSGITGYYEFHNIPSGTYYLVAVRDGYTLETKIAVIP